MNRQKRYHDRKLSYEAFEPGDSVYIFFPVRKSGCSSKLTSYWRGPFKVSKKLSDVLYEVNCGRYGCTQVIHVDRIRKAKHQFLLGEEEEVGQYDLEREAPQKEHDEYEEDDYLSEEVNRPRRIRRKPAW